MLVIPNVASSKTPDVSIDPMPFGATSSNGAVLGADRAGRQGRINSVRRRQFSVSWATTWTAIRVVTVREPGRYGRRGPSDHRH